MTVLASGPEALRRVRKFAQTMPEQDPPPLRVGSTAYPMAAGTVYPPDKMIIFSGGGLVDYLWINQGRWELIELSGPQFATTLNLDAESRGAATAAWLIPVAKVEAAFMIGLLAGPVEIVGANLVELAAWGSGHRAEVKEGITLVQQLVPELRNLRAKCPTLWNQLMRSTCGSLLKAFESQIASNFTSGTNIASFLGGLAGSWSKAADAATAKGLRSFVEQFTSIIKGTAEGLYRGARFNVAQTGVGPSMVAHGMQATIRKEIALYPGRKEGLLTLCAHLSRFEAILNQMNSEISAAKGGGKLSAKPAQPAAESHSVLLRLRKELFGM